MQNTENAKNAKNEIIGNKQSMPNSQRIQKCMEFKIAKTAKNAEKAIKRG